MMPWRWALGNKRICWPWLRVVRRSWRSFSNRWALTLTQPLGVLMRSPNLRRDSAATFTDALRLALVRALGYEATATEFIPSAHTPKNRLLLAEKRGRYNKAGLAEFQTLRTTLGSPTLALERMLADVLAERFPDFGKLTLLALLTSCPVWKRGNFYHRPASSRRLLRAGIYSSGRLLDAFGRSAWNMVQASPIPLRKPKKCPLQETCAFTATSWKSMPR